VPGEWAEHELELVNTITFMGLIEKGKLLFKSEPERSFIKAGVMDTNGQLTSEGRELWTEFLIRKFGAEFKTEVVDKIIAEDAKTGA
jgi:hypothetical protein